MAKVRPQQIRRRNNMLGELAELLTQSLLKHGVAPAKADDEAKELAFQLHRRWAGITFTFPVKDEVAMARLEMHIMDEYDGTNADQLVRKYGVTEDWIYATIRKHHKRRIDKNQLNFDLGESL